MTFGYTGGTTTVPRGDAKNRLSEYVTDVEHTHDRVTITRHRRTAASQPAWRSSSAHWPKIHIRLGGALRGQLAGLRPVRRGSYRIIYNIDDERRRVDIVHINHRGDVYR